MYVPVNAATAAWAAVVLAAARPRGAVELGLVDLPDAARASEEGERHRPADRQEFGRPDRVPVERSNNLEPPSPVSARAHGGDRRRPIYRAEGFWKQSRASANAAVSTRTASMALRSERTAIRIAQ
jgi:hypothetical protein